LNKKRGDKALTRFLQNISFFILYQSSTTGDLIQYNKTTSVWEEKQVRVS